MFSKFEYLLMGARTNEERLNMENVYSEDLTEEQIIKLKAQYMGCCPETVKAMLNGRKEIAKRTIQLGIV